MVKLRRRLATWALALLCCQTAAVFAAPLSSCCSTRGTIVAEAEKDCCPAGSHPPGECPRHAASKTAPKASCRVQCDAPHGMQFLVGVLGVPLTPGVFAVTLDAGALVGIADAASDRPPSRNTAPPPRLS